MNVYSILKRSIYIYITCDGTCLGHMVSICVKSTAQGVLVWIHFVRLFEWKYFIYAIPVVVTGSIWHVSAIYIWISELEMEKNVYCCLLLLKML